VTGHIACRKLFSSLPRPKSMSIACWHSLRGLPFKVPVKTCSAVVPATIVMLARQNVFTLKHGDSLKRPAKENALLLSPDRGLRAGMSCFRSVDNP